MHANELPSVPGGEVIVYESKDGEARVDVRFDQETVWLTQRQLAEVFHTPTDNVSLYLKDTYATGELEEAATTEDFSIVRLKGQGKGRRGIKHYNPDAIIFVGYRVHSKRAVRIRQWATRARDEPLVSGYTMNERPGRGGEPALFSHQGPPLHRRQQAQLHRATLA